MEPAPEIQALLDQLADAAAPPIREQSLEEARLGLEGLGMLAIPVEVGAVEDRVIDGPGGDLAVRIYRPADAEPTPPVLVWFHGGGWVLGSLESTDQCARGLCRESGAVVVSVDYRLAPEHPAPAAVEDAHAAVGWVRANAEALGADAGRLAVGGDSAGGNIAAVVAQQTDVRFQLLVYPVTSLTMDTPSMRENAEGYLLTRETMIWFRDHYLSGGADPTDPAIAPLLADDLAGVAPALVITAGFDPLRDEGRAYAERLEAAGVDCELVQYDDQIHAFFQLTAITPTAVEAQALAGARLAAALA